MRRGANKDICHWTGRTFTAQNGTISKDNQSFSDALTFATLTTADGFVKNVNKRIWNTMNPDVFNSRKFFSILNLCDCTLERYTSIDIMLMGLQTAYGVEASMYVENSHSCSREYQPS